MNSTLAKSIALILLPGLMLSTVFAGKSSAGGVRDGGVSEGSIYLRDFSKATPQDSISSTSEDGKWLLKPFGNESILFADGSSQLPALTYPLDLRGWYDLYVGVFEPPYPVDIQEFRGIHVKLTGDRWFSHIYGGRTGLGREWENGLVDEIYWKRADLTGQDLVIYQPWGKFHREPGGIAYVRLIPVSEEKVREDIERDEQVLLKARQKDVGGMADFYTWVFWTQGTQSKDTERMMEFHKNAGMNTVYFMINANGMVGYPSRFAQWYYWYPKEEPREAAKAIVNLLKNHDPVKVASEYAHRNGMKFFPWFRVTNEFLVESDVNEYTAKLYNDKYRIKGPDGVPLRWPSLAYKEVRDYKLAILRELATNYDVDGLLLDFQRTMPAIGYEPAVVDAYVKKYGVNPTTSVAERSSPRWKKFRAGYITIFMRDLKRIVSEQEKKTGKKIQIAARVTPRDNLWKGLDVETWIKEGLLDVVMPSNYFVFDSVVPVKPFKQMVKGTKCKVIVCVNPYFIGWTDDPEHDVNKNEQDVAEIIFRRYNEGPSNIEYARQVLRYYADGADGVAFYESDLMTPDPPFDKSAERILSAFTPGRPGLLPMFRALSNPKDLLSYVKSQTSDAAAEAK